MDILGDKSIALSCVTTAEDKELDYEASIDIDIRHVNLASHDSKVSNALKHLDIFLASRGEASCKSTHPKRESAETLQLLQNNSQDVLHTRHHLPATQ
jgi:hypothetical protein